MALSIPIISEFDGKGIKKAVAQFKQLETTGQRVGFVLKKAGQAAAVGFAAIGAAAVAAGAAMWSFAKLAMEDQKSQRQLAASIKAVTKATDAQIASTEEWITQTQLALGIADDELRPALGRLVRSTKSVEAAQRLLNTALDVSAATGKPLEQVVNALGKAYDGSNMALGRLGLGFSKAELKGMKFAAIQERLNKQFGGAAGKQAETFEGLMARLSQTFNELKESLGTAIIPYLEKVARWGIKLGEYLGENGLTATIKLLADQFRQLTMYDDKGRLNAFGKTVNFFARAFNAISRTTAATVKTLQGGSFGEVGGAFRNAPTFGTQGQFAPLFTGPVARNTAGAPVIINFNGIVGDPPAVGREIKKLLDAYGRRIGTAGP